MIFSAHVRKSLLAVSACLLLANCSSSKVAGVDPKYGVKPSPRVVAEGQPVPKGGGRQMVGREYRVAGKVYRPYEKDEDWYQEGLASWYGDAFHGRKTANGEVFDKESVSAAHPTMPLPSYARVTNMQNRRSIIVRVNDRGPFHGNRVLDVSRRTAELLDFKRMGTANVRVEYIRNASLGGSDDRILAQTLRTDGALASLDSVGVGRTQLVQAEPLPLPVAQNSFSDAPLRSRSDDAPLLQRVQVATTNDGLLPLPSAPSALQDSSVTQAPLDDLLTVDQDAVASMPELKFAPNVPVPVAKPLDLMTMPNAALPTPFVPVPTPAPLPSLSEAPLAAQSYASAPLSLSHPIR